MAVQRWVFNDFRGETWVIPLNPTSMTPVHRRRAVTSLGTTAVDGRDLLFEGRSQPREWSFSGKIHSYAHHEGLRHWVYDKTQRIQITDHFGRPLLVVLNEFDAEPRNRVNRRWFHEYTVKGILLDVGAATVLA